jgi:type IV secretory pathway VirB10-like protein
MGSEGVSYMSNNTDPLSPDNSPNAPGKTGVRRVNNLPLIIAISALALFVAMIAMVAVKRSNQQHTVIKEEKNASGNTDTSTMANAVIGDRSGGIVAEKPKPLPLSLQNKGIPVATPNNLDAPPLPPRLAAPVNPELAQIQQAKFQEFETAVKAKTDVPIKQDIGKNASAGNNASLGNDQLSNSDKPGSSDDANISYQEKLAKIRANLEGRGLEGDDSNSPGLAPNNDIQQFGGDDKNDRWKLNSQMQAPASPYEIRTGTIIPSSLITGINSELPGKIWGQVSQDVYDTATGKYLLIPHGTHLMGTYSNNIVYGQSAVLVAWQRLIFPDGKALDIGAMPGTDSAGYSGFRDQVNNHYLRIFGSALLMTGIVAGVAYSQDKNNNSSVFSPPTVSSELSQSLGQQLGQVSAQMISKNLNISPTIEISPGYPFSIIVVKDLVFAKPYKSFDY